jgi:UDP-glucose 4-epimerase
MVVTNLRFATACGWSPRLRLDLALNDFVACALVSHNISVLSDGTPWRPLIDVEDMCRAISWAVTRREGTGGKFLSVNIGSNDRNYQVGSLANSVANLIAGTRVSINEEAPSDTRSYAVDFSLYEKLAPHHQPQITLAQSILRLKDGLERMEFNDPRFRESIYMRLNLLRGHIEKGLLDKNLRWSISPKSN